MTVVLETVEYVARKRHRCDDCLRFIEPGDRYCRTRMIAEGEPETYKSHVECEAARHDLHALWDLYPDEGVSLVNDVGEDDHEYLLTEHPVVAGRLGIKPKESKTEPCTQGAPLQARAALGDKS